jgi:hypothetical protein
LSLVELVLGFGLEGIFWTTSASNRTAALVVPLLVR